jgi:hypothetical protein
MSYLALGSSAIRATSHPFAHAKSAIRWLQWLLRNLSILDTIFWLFSTFRVDVRFDKHLCDALPRPNLDIDGKALYRH